MTECTLTTEQMAEQKANFEKLKKPVWAMSFVGAVSGALLGFGLTKLFDFGLWHDFAIAIPAMIFYVALPYAYLKATGWTDNEEYRAYCDALPNNDYRSSYTSPSNWNTNPTYSHVPGNSFYRG